MQEQSHLPTFSFLIVVLNSATLISIKHYQPEKFSRCLQAAPPPPAAGSIPSTDTSLITAQRLQRETLKVPEGDRSSFTGLNCIWRYILGILRRFRLLHWVRHLLKPVGVIAPAEGDKHTRQTLKELSEKFVVVLGQESLRHATPPQQETLYKHV